MLVSSLAPAPPALRARASAGGAAGGVRGGGGRRASLGAACLGVEPGAEELEQVRADRGLAAAERGFAVRVRARSPALCGDGRLAGA
jgi:hypothetical protein